MTREEIAVGRSAAERIIEALAILTMRGHDEDALEVASTGARTLHSLFNGGATEICLDAVEMKYLTKGGSIDYEVDAGTVSFSIKA